jgi:hypothetical protein
LRGNSRAGIEANRRNGPASAGMAGSATIAPATSTENHLLRMQKPSMKNRDGTQKKRRRNTAEAANRRRKNSP